MRIAEKELAWTFRACKRVHLLERAGLPVLLVVLVFSLVLELVALLALVLLPFLDITSV